MIDQPFILKHLPDVEVMELASQVTEKKPGFKSLLIKKDSSGLNDRECRRLFNMTVIGKLRTAAYIEAFNRGLLQKNF